MLEYQVGAVVEDAKTQEWVVLVGVGLKVPSWLAAARAQGRVVL